MNSAQPQQAIGAAKPAKPARQFYRPGRQPRIPLSCDPCRTRKLKCNREKPCQNCTARDERPTCKYKGPGTKIGSTLSTPTEDHGFHAMQQRIDQLEGLVKRLLAQHPDSSPNTSSTGNSPGSLTGSAVTPPSSLDASGVACSIGTTVIDGTQSVYQATDDWYDVLKEINTIKNVWSRTQSDENDYHVPLNLSNKVDGSSLLFSQIKKTDLLEILASLPPKAEMDKLLADFFDPEFPIKFPPLLHQATFMREYAQHCKDPSRTNVMWLGLLFSILSITMLSYHQFHHPSEYEGKAEPLFDLYRMRTAQCLTTGDIAKCSPYTLETLRFNATAEFNRKDDNSRGLWIMTGVIIRAAINMGYHVDPSRVSSISTLKAEYRRRVWLSVLTMDDLASFQMGFPRMFPAIYSDTLEPRNVHDWELSEGTTILPPSRPLTEPTTATYMIVKGRLARSLGRITDFNNTQGSRSYDAVLKLDASLYEAYQSFPSHMKFGDRGVDIHSLDEKSEIPNFQLASLYHQGMCTLHRKFMSKSRLDTQYKLSHDRCITSALEILRYQYALDAPWYKFSQIRQMLTLATMILFLELEYRRQEPDQAPASDASALFQALENSCALWEKFKNSCDETRRIGSIVSSILSSFHTTVQSKSSQDSTVTSEPLSKFPGFNLQFQQINGSLPWENDFLSTSNGMDFDWGKWDALIDGADYGDGFEYNGPE